MTFLQKKGQRFATIDNGSMASGGQSSEVILLCSDLVGYIKLTYDSLVQNCPKFAILAHSSSILQLEWYFCTHFYNKNPSEWL